MISTCIVPFPLYENHENVLDFTLRLSLNPGACLVSGNPMLSNAARILGDHGGSRMMGIRATHLKIKYRDFGT